MKIIRTLGVLAASTMLSGCFLVPSKFGADVDIRKAGDFTVAYKGEILFQMPDDFVGSKMKPKVWDDAFATCYASGRTMTDEYASVETHEAAIRSFTANTGVNYLVGRRKRELIGVKKGVE